MNDDDNKNEIIYVQNNLSRLSPCIFTLDLLFLDRGSIKESTCFLSLVDQCDLVEEVRLNCITWQHFCHQPYYIAEEQGTSRLIC